jgi:hypothetical protein
MHGLLESGLGKPALFRTQKEGIATSWHVGAWAQRQSSFE